MNKHIKSGFCLLLVTLFTLFSPIASWAEISDDIGYAITLNTGDSQITFWTDTYNISTHTFDTFYTYYPNNLTHTIENNESTITFYYDSEDRISIETITFGDNEWVMTYNYDSNDNVSSITSSLAGKKYYYTIDNPIFGNTYEGQYLFNPRDNVYNSDGFLIEDTLWYYEYSNYSLIKQTSKNLTSSGDQPYQITYTYYPDNLLKDAQYSDGLKNTYYYDPLNRAIKLVRTKGSITLTYFATVPGYLDSFVLIDGEGPKTYSEGVCGNLVWEPTNDEECDDGNTISGDGCSNGCKLEEGEAGDRDTSSFEFNIDPILIAIIVVIIVIIIVLVKSRIDN